MTVHYAVAELLREVRLLTPLSKEDVAFYTDLAPSAFYRIEKAQRNCMLITCLQLLHCYACALGYELHSLHLPEALLRCLREHKELHLVVTDQDQRREYTQEEWLLVKA